MQDHFIPNMAAQGESQPDAGVRNQKMEWNAGMANQEFRFHPDELRDQFAHEERNGLDDLTDASAAMWIIVYIFASAALFLALCIAVWAYWPSQVPLTCQSYIGGEIVACAEGV